MIKNIFDALNAIDEAINAGLDNVIAYTRKVQDNGDNYSLKVDVPGFEREEIEIDVVDNILNLKVKNAENSKGFVFYVPKDIDKDQISASLKNGQLIITLPKKTTPKPTTRKIRIT